MNHFTVVLALIETKVYNKKHFLCYEIQILIVLNFQKKKKIHQNFSNLPEKLHFLDILLKCFLIQGFLNKSS